MLKERTNLLKNQMRYTINLSYDGSAFNGWQVQNDAPSVQGALQDALAVLLRHETGVTGAGRTDTGVNAVGYIAHFDTTGPLPCDTALFMYKLNAILPRGIVINEISPATEDFHARFDAISREYHYFIHYRKDPFVEGWSWQCRQRLDLERMQKASGYLLGEHDFSCFEKTGGNNATSICTVFDAGWEKYEPTHVGLLGAPACDGDYIVFHIRANRFLRNMVRAVVGSMVQIGLGKHEPEWILELLESGNRSDAGESVPGKALFLNEVKY